MLTKAQINKIEEIIRRRFLAFGYEALGDRALTLRELRELKRLGLIRENVRDFVTDPYTLGKIVSIVDRSKLKDLTFAGVLQAATKIGPEQTSVERASIEYAKDHAGQYIKGLGDTLTKEIVTRSARKGIEALRQVKAKVSEALTNRKTSGELKTSLFDAIDDTYRDWQRVASTEIQDAIQNGIYNEIKRTSDDGENQLVYKRVAPNACKHCRALYLKADGVTPKVFRLKDLAASNVGRKVADWGPTVGPVHPWCQCQLFPVVEGFEFVKTKVVSDPFTSHGKEFKLGQIVYDDEYNGLSESQRGKIRADATLQYTGKTSRRDA